MEKLKMHSPDFVEQNIAQLAELFPSCVVESEDENGQLKKAIDFDQLRQELSGSLVDGPRERYHLDWPGKKQALLAANAPIGKTLRPSRDESIDFEKTKNIFIEGDNLDALKLLQENYLNKVKLICIDPPYNRASGKDLVYRDNHSLDSQSYLLRSMQLGPGEERLMANPETNGRFHSDWLSMIFPRLRIAQRLLSPDGIIIVHIDDNEVHNLISIMNEVFGRKNFVSVLIWNKQHSQQQGLFKRYHEYAIVFAKSAENLDNITGGDGVIDAGAIKKVSTSNPASRFVFPKGTRFDAPDGTVLSGTYGGAEQVTVLAGRLVAKNGKTLEDVVLEAGWTQRKQMESWFSGKDTFDSKGQRVLEFYLNSAGKPKCLKKRSKVTPPSILPSYGMVSTHTAYLRNLMGEEVFPTPKPVEMAQQFAAWFTKNDDIVMDFFAGSGTTAEGVFRQNATDGQKRRALLVQLPEKLDIDNPKQSASARYCDKLGVPRNIAELTKERLRLSGKRLLANRSSVELPVDIGFRVFKIESSNMKDVYYSPDELKQVNLIDQIENIKGDRTPEDLLFQVLLDWGVDLSLPIAEETIENNTVFFVDGNALAACFDMDINEALVKELAARKPLRAVFRDSGFRNDSAKINVEQIFKLISPSTEVKSL